MLTLVREIARFFYLCRSCDFRWSEFINNATTCPKCGGEAKLYGLGIEKVAE